MHPGLIRGGLRCRPHAYRLRREREQCPLILKPTQRGQVFLRRGGEGVVGSRGDDHMGTRVPICGVLEVLGGGPCPWGPSVGRRHVVQVMILPLAFKRCLHTVP